MSTLKKALSICIENDKNVAEVMTNIGHLLECQRHHKQACYYYANATNMMKPTVHPQLVTNMHDIRVLLAKNATIIH